MYIDYERLFKVYGVHYIASGDHHCTEGWLSFYCPFCSPTKYHLGLNKKSGKWNCWSCGSHNEWFVLSVLLNKSVTECKQIVKKFVLPGVSFRDDVEYFAEIKSQCSLPFGCAELSVEQKRYLRSRNFNPEKVVDLYNVVGTPPYSKIGDCIVIPIYWQGIRVSWIARKIKEGSGPRYLKCPKKEQTYPISKILYGWESIRKKAVVVEGIFDKWRLGPGSVCTLGLGVSEEQVRLLGSLNQVFILFDSDKPARKRSNDLARRLSSVVDVEILEIDVADPAELTEQEAKKIMEVLGFEKRKSFSRKV
jgi:5S rRNA maturation endonuclease (ribonuclease M5)